MQQVDVTERVVVKSNGEKGRRKHDGVEFLSLKNIRHFTLVLSRTLQNNGSQWKCICGAHSEENNTKTYIYVFPETEMLVLLWQVQIPNWKPFSFSNSLVCQL